MPGCETYCVHVCFSSETVTLLLLSRKPLKYASAPGLSFVSCYKENHNGSVFQAIKSQFYSQNNYFMVDARGSCFIIYTNHHRVLKVL
jgi:hypothetical protein